MKNSLFLRFLRSLLITYSKTLSLEKGNYCFEKKFSFICYRERALINDYFTLLASLEYNMQEIQKVQKLVNDLVDITVTVR